MFNSQKINNDPTPWIDVFGHGRKYQQRYERDAYDPRPEFDNNPNPILVGIREGENDVRSALDMLRDDAREWWNPLVVTDAHIAHARKVLERLAALT